MASYKAAKASMEVCCGFGPSVAGKFLESVQISRLPNLGGPRGEIVVLDAGSQFRGTAKKTTSFSRREAGEPRRFQIGVVAMRGGLGYSRSCESRSSGFWSARSGKLGAGRMAMAAHQMVVHQADCLHEGIDDWRATELETAACQLL